MIKFTKTDVKYGCFSNFYPCEVEYEGIVYPNSECAWQSLKTLDPEQRARFASYTAAGAKKMGRRVALRPDWEDIKYQLMIEVCYAKFSQNADLKDILLSTKNEMIVENTTAWHDNIWGNCECERCRAREGKNLLGKALMEVRDRIKNETVALNTRLKQKLEKPLLLVIDMQNIYSKGQKWECVNFERSLSNIKRLLDHQAGSKTIFTRYIAAADPQGIWKDYNAENSDVNMDEWVNELVVDLRNIPYKYDCYNKSVYSSYSIEQIRNEAADSSCVLVTGVVAECCVLSTVMSLIDAGVYVIYLKDAVSGIDAATEAATIKVLEGLAPLHLSIMTTEEYLRINGML